jgi:hypothetical protein
MAMSSENNARISPGYSNEKAVPSSEELTKKDLLKAVDQDDEEEQLDHVVQLKQRKTNEQRDDEHKTRLS